MHKQAMSLMTILLTGAVVSAQNPTTLFTQPSVPSSDILNRFNLKLAWQMYLPTEGRRDGIFSVQIPERLQPPGGLILVQTRSAVVMAIDSATGTMLWRTPVGMPFAMRQRLGYNSKQIFVANGVDLYALNRDSGQIEWVFRLPHVASAPPVADDEYLYIGLGTGRLYGYRLPKPGETVPTPVVAEGRDSGPAASRQGTASGSPSSRTSMSALGVSGQAVSAISAISSLGQSVRSISAISSSMESHEAGVARGPQPQFVWDYVAESRLELAPLISTNYLLVATYAGSFTAMRKLDGGLQYHFQATAPLSAPLGQHGDMAYVGSEDFSVSALDMFAGQVHWRFLGAGPIRQKPEVNDESVYLAPERSGLYRLDRETGRVVWRNPNAERFLAANRKFVYATDRSGRLLILDRARGTELAVYDGAHDFVVPIINEMTDRLFLASNDGLLLCLHDRQYSTPLRMKTVAGIQNPAPEAVGQKAGAGQGEMKNPEPPK
jgi:outer membrane protein assembly factor BamB